MPYNHHTKLKYRVHRRDNFTCRLKLSPKCLGSMKENYEKYLKKQMTRRRVGLTVDHLKPLSKNGSWSMNNLVTACRPCNKLKADREINIYGTIKLHNKN